MYYFDSPKNVGQDPPLSIHVQLYLKIISYHILSCYIILFYFILYYIILYYIYYGI